MKILLIDDSPFILKMIKQGLEARFPACDVKAANPVQTGLPPTTELRHYDLMILDVNLGAAGDGIDWLDQMEAKHGQPPVVLISADDPAEMAARVTDAGAIAYFAKGPELVADLARLVRLMRAAQAA